MKTIRNERYQESYDVETLDNGLRVVIWHKPGYARSLFMMATPLGAMDICQVDEHGTQCVYPAGIAHFLEHKMFEKKDRDVMDDFSRMGASVNAFTSYGETAYFFSTSEDVREPLNLLLDFVQDLDISDASVEKEKGIIVSELNMYLQMSDNRLLMETYKSLFHEHPLKYDIGGDEESVRSITRTQLEECYARNYHPSRMMLVAVSGRDPEEIMAIIKENQHRKTFSPRQNWRRKPLREPDEVVRAHHAFEMEITTPKIAVAYKLKPVSDVHARMRQEWCLRLAQDLWFSSMNEDYQKWLDEGVISDFVGADADLGEDYGVLLFYTESEKTPQFESLIDELIRRMQEEPVSARQLDQLKHRYYGQSVRTLNSFDDIAIGYIRSAFAGYDYLEAMDVIETITPQEVSEACRCIVPQRKAVVIVNPKKK